MKKIITVSTNWPSVLFWSRSCVITLACLNVRIVVRKFCSFIRHYPWSNSFGRHLFCKTVIWYDRYLSSQLFLWDSYFRKRYFGRQLFCEAIFFWGRELVPTLAWDTYSPKKMCSSDIEHSGYTVWKLVYTVPEYNTLRKTL